MLAAKLAAAHNKGSDALSKSVLIDQHRKTLNYRYDMLRRRDYDHEGIIPSHVINCSCH